ncbi:hypothetical protein [Risungbinella massiliensis]|uniref:hypothetical protein n=1 Tax=Risungbinella massiliensis TaxID=1329796 RepID=UPI0012B569E8|nr:hypothetical protein [Risungbinella massiliensis]
MAQEDNQTNEKGTFLTDVRFAPDTFDVFEIAEKMDEVEGNNREEMKKENKADDSHK